MGAISVHGANGLWGVISVGLFAGQRVSAHAELEGLDLPEMGALGV